MAEHHLTGSESQLPADAEAADGSPEAPPAAVDLVAVVENRGFASARCSCGWIGPGRRSRRLARTDAAEHLTQAHPAHPSGL